MSKYGRDDFSKKLNKLADNARDLGNTKRASITDILTPAFISENTRFKNAYEFFIASGLGVSSQEDFEAIPEDKLDTFVHSESSFASWREFLNTAGAQWAKRKLR